MSENLKKVRLSTFFLVTLYPSTGDRIVIDVAVGNPAAVSYRTRPPGHPPLHPSYDHVRVSYAAEHREAVKISRYRNLAGMELTTQTASSLLRWMRARR